MSIRLHKTDEAKVLWGDVLEDRKGLLDKTETLHLIYRKMRWHVSVQRNGFRLMHFALQSDARVYMEYMLEHAEEALREIPIDGREAQAYAYTSKIFETHCEAKASIFERK